MSDPVAPLGSAAFEGSAMVRETGPLGMITLRARPDAPGLAKAVKLATGCALPAQRAIVEKDGRAAAWMSPDEYLLLLPRADVPKALADLAKALKDQHHLAADVSDARAVFSVTGPKADEVVARLAPLDFALLPEGEIRRTRLAQVACALWRQGGGLTIITFRSVARYAFDILVNAAR
jgi:sarcosine oxidase, subunit gamma